MKFNGLGFALITCAAAYKDLVDIHGHLPANLNMAPWKGRTRIARSAEYYSMRDPAICKFPLEIVILQDATASFQDDFLQMKDVQLPLMLKELVQPFPGSTVGVVSHRDKPFLPYGNETDYCQKFEQPLTNNLGLLQTLYAGMISTGGADPPENSFGALVATLQSATPGWSNELATKVVVVATDAQPHFSNDTDNIYGLPPFSGVFDEANAAAQCTEQYYPSPEQVRAATGAREAYIVPLVFDGSEQDFLVLRSWQWLNNYLGQTPEFINTMANDASDFWFKLKIALAKISEIECGHPDTTTPAPTTVPTVPTITTVPTVPTIPTITTVPTVPTIPTLPTVPTTVPTIPTVIPTLPTTIPPVTLPTPCECPPCASDPCDPCSCSDGVLIKLKHRPQKLSLVVENPNPLP